MRYRFSANLGFLWKNLNLRDAAVRAHKAGFDCIECHFPYATDPGALRDTLAQLDIPLLALNTAPGPKEGDFGLAAVPGRWEDAKAVIRQAFAYAKTSGAANVHVMAGRTPWGKAAKLAFTQSLGLACELAEMHEIGVLIEPLNGADVPDYCLLNFDHAHEVIEQVGSSRLKIMFDCYHARKQGLNVLEAFNDFRPNIGHVQIAGVQDRGPPLGAPYPTILSEMATAGYRGAFGAEFIYDPNGGEAQFAWIDAYQQGRVCRPH